MCPGASTASSSVIVSVRFPYTIMRPQPGESENCVSNEYNQRHSFDEFIWEWNETVVEQAEAPQSAAPSRADNRLVLVADDDQSIRSLLKSFLDGEGFRVVEAKSGRDVLPAVTRYRPDVVIMDVRMPGMSGLDVLDNMKRLNMDNIPVLMMTAYGTSNVAIEAIQRGAYDYVTKPFELDDLLITVRRTLDHRDLAEKVRAVDETIRDPLDNIIGNTVEMQHVYKALGRVARTDATILVNGESGTGKELVAGALHFNSHRRSGPFVKVPCASLTETLLESELFGHEAGSFTSAVKTRKGRFEMAD